jgi:diguanylate cyclase (GGDEF)-like protein
VERIKKLFPSTLPGQYAVLRGMTIVFLLGLYWIGVAGPAGTTRSWIYIAALVVLAVDSLILYVLNVVRHGDYAESLLRILPFDLVAIAAFVWLLHDQGDAFFPVCIFVPVTYALAVKKHEVWAVGVATAGAYTAGHLIAHSQGAEAFPVFALKIAAIPFIAAMIAQTVEQQRFREQEVLTAVGDLARANDSLEQRMSELQAVSQITEVIHSTLDFERIGPIVLDIIAKVISVSACCLFVIDKAKSETLFSASIGNIAGTADPGLIGEIQRDDHFSCVPVLDHASTMVLFCAAAEDIARLSEEDRIVLNAVASELVVAVENSRLYKLTKQLAITDELTGLYNYRFLQHRLDEEIERSRRYDKHLSLLMIDVDDFKIFNDTHGHLAGDEALADLAKVMRTVVREVDVVARYGGEEFSIVLPETDAAGAYVVAEKVREAASEHLFSDEDGMPKCLLTISIGLSTYPAHAEDKESLLRGADDALYHAKNGGKNRVRSPQVTRIVDGPGAAPREGDMNIDEWTES